MGRRLSSSAFAGVVEDGAGGGGEWVGWDSFGAFRFIRGREEGVCGLFVPVWITVFVLMDVFGEQVMHLDV